ncbi:MAG: hypothetical protein ACRDQZ_11380 [Mycobacteriales bacterium]
MARGALAFPVPSGKTEADIRSIANAFKADPKGYWESRQSIGCTMERAYWQQTPMGDFVVAYLESSAGSVAEAFGRAAADETPMGKFFRTQVLAVHGIDITQPPPGPPPEVVAQWSDPMVTKRGKGFAFGAPLIPEMESYAREWAADAFAREGMTESRRALKGCLEIVTLIPTPQGPIVAVYVEGEDPVAANAGFAASTSDFDMWFKENLAKIFPPFIDFSQPVPGVTEIFDSESIAMVDLTGKAVKAKQTA